MAKVAGGGNNDAARLITRSEKAENIFTAKAVDGLLTAANRPADGMILEEIEIEKIMYIIVRRIFRLGNFLKDLISFAFDFLSFATYMEEQICQYIHCHRQIT